MRKKAKMEEVKVSESEMGGRRRRGGSGWKVRSHLNCVSKK